MPRVRGKALVPLPRAWVGLILVVLWVYELLSLVAPELGQPRGVVEVLPAVKVAPWVPEVLQKDVLPADYCWLQLHL